MVRGYKTSLKPESVGSQFSDVRTVLIQYIVNNIFKLWGYRTN